MSEKIRPIPLSPAYKEAISVQEMRDRDAYTIAHFTPGLELMYRAAQGVFAALDWTGKTVAILVGSGNNGGDGYALAEILTAHGISAVVYQTSEKRSADGAYYAQKALEIGVSISLYFKEVDLSCYDILVDCILGTGFQGQPRGLAADAIRAMNETQAFVVSVDINSGMNGDTGEAVLAVRSDLTVSIGYYKTGLFLGRAPELIGALVNVDIGIVPFTEKE